MYLKSNLNCSVTPKAYKVAKTAGLKLFSCDVLGLGKGEVLSMARLHLISRLPTQAALDAAECLGLHPETNRQYKKVLVHACEAPKTLCD